jgi:hypothetical protein
MGECQRSYEAGYEKGYNAGARIALREVEEGLMSTEDDWKNYKPTMPDSARDARIAKRMAERVPPSSPKRKPTAANKKYSKNFAKVKPRFMTKAGKWKKNGFRNAVRAAHKLGRSKK